MRIDTGGGDLTANGLTGNFQLSTEGGDVDANGVASGTTSMHSGGGNVTLAFTQVPQNLQITAEGGNVTVILPLGSTKYDISTPDRRAPTSATRRRCSARSPSTRSPSTAAAATSPSARAELERADQGGDV